MSCSKKILFIFVDGLGIGADDPSINPLAGGQFPTLEKLITEAVPLDAGLGVDGLPQSATGQTALLTGINAPKAMGRHIEGFPPPSLKKLIEQENLFRRLIQTGRQCTFANCYYNITPEQIPPRRRSVTTVMTLSALGRVRGNAELMEGKAVAHDITRKHMRLRGYDGAPIAPQIAAQHLMSIATENNFTLFEYFISDRAGHSADFQKAEHCLKTLEQFIEEARHFAKTPGHLLLLSSDHGNIEDLSVRTHTRNPVPLIALGDGADSFYAAQTLCDVTPTILRLYGS